MNLTDRPIALTGKRPIHRGAPVAGWPYVIGLLASVLAWHLAWYGGTAQSIVETWARSETFTHGFLILPISAWLVWRRRRDIAALPPKPSFVALAALALLGMGWLLGLLSSTDIVQQFAMVAMIPFLVWAILGTRITSLLLFPLFFLLFAVPFGEFLVPSLMAYTADFTVFALRATGVPVYREGQYFMTPTGNWSVVEACGGLRYLIASLTIGFLYAHLTYRSLKRRVLFVAASIVVPIVANWLRAYMIVMIGHLSDMKYAVGVDHLIYGWIFFGMVMLLLFWLGSFWREDPAPIAAAPFLQTAAQYQQSRLGGVLAAAILAAATVAAWPVAAYTFERARPHHAEWLNAPDERSGWVPVPTPTWAPSFINPVARVNQIYEKGANRVGLYIGLYLNQRRGSELVTSQNMLVRSTDHAWKKVAENRHVLAWNGTRHSIIQSHFHGSSMRKVVWHWYWVDGVYTSSAYMVKLLQARSRLMGRGDASAIVVFYTDVDRDSMVAGDILQDFAMAMLPRITKSLSDAR